MRKRNTIIYFLTGILLILVQSNRAQEALLDILTEELSREMEALKTESDPPYYMEYRVNDMHSYSLKSSFGSLISKSNDRARILTATVKVGNYDFDNTHQFKGSFNPSSGMSPSYSIIPFEDEPLAIKQTLWRATDQAYSNALSTYQTFKSKKEEELNKSKLPDFSKEEVVKYYDEPLTESDLSFDFDEWTRKLKAYTHMFLEDTAIFMGDAELIFMADRKYFVSSEGSSIVQNSYLTQLQLVASVKNEKGNVFPLFKSYFAFKPSGLPDDEQVKKDIEELIKKLLVMKTAPMAEPYTGPAILSPGAAGVFFHEIFGHRIEGHRMKSEFDGQTFVDKVGTRVLPKEFAIISNPKLNSFAGQDLLGTYGYDEQGVKGQSVQVVEDGVLKNFLMSRTPIEGFEQSLGHGRAQAGAAPVSRQSNLIIQTSKPYTDQELRKKLISACKKQKKKYGYYFKQVYGGFTITDRYNPNVFNIIPTEVYRVYVDGRPDELVCGVGLIGTPLVMFSQIKAGGDKPQVFTGFCGAESGSIPVSAISPALYVEQIETQKMPEYTSERPILPSPDLERKANKQDSE